PETWQVRKAHQGLLATSGSLPAPPQTASQAPPQANRDLRMSWRWLPGRLRRARTAKRKGKHNTKGKEQRPHDHPSISFKEFCHGVFFIRSTPLRAPGK